MQCIGIDCRFADAKAGLGTFTRELVTALLPLLSDRSVVLFIGRDTSWLPSPLPAHVRTAQAPFAAYSAAEQFSFPNLIQSEKIDLFFAPHFNVPLFLTVPFVATVHDLILHRYPGNASLLKRLAYRFVLRRTVKNAKAILTVSQFTKDDLIHHYGTRVESKTHVVYPGVSSIFSPRSETEQSVVRSRYSLTAPYFLYVGGCKQHKNVQTLIDAFASANLGETELVLIANGRECASLTRKPRVRFLQNVPTDDLPALYSAALASVTATLDEGFYLPGVEALACGSLALATNVGAIPEVLGNNAMLVEPHAAAIADGLRSCIKASQRRNAVTFKQYDWRESAKTVVHLF